MTWASTDQPAAAFRAAGFYPLDIILHDSYCATALCREKDTDSATPPSVAVAYYIPSACVTDAYSHHPDDLGPMAYYTNMVTVDGKQVIVRRVVELMVCAVGNIATLPNEFTPPELVLTQPRVTPTIPSLPDSLDVLSFAYPVLPINYIEAIGKYGRSQLSDKLPALENAISTGLYAQAWCATVCAAVGMTPRDALIHASELPGGSQIPFFRPQPSKWKSHPHALRSYSADSPVEGLLNPSADGDKLADFVSEFTATGMYDAWIDLHDRYLEVTAAYHEAT